MEEMIIQFATTYGWQLALIAFSGIVILGIFKFFKIFDKIKKESRKYVYAGISSGLSIIASAIYLLVTNVFTWGGFGVIAGSIYALNQSIYAVYESIGIRALLRKIGNAFITFIAKNQLEAAKAKLQAQENDEIK